jgi:hypothetical protein
MLARPPEKKPFFPPESPAFLSPHIANDNYPPKKIYVGWILCAVGLLFLLAAYFWI